MSSQRRSFPATPYWLRGDRPATVASLEQRAFATLWREAIGIPGPVTDALGEAARAADAYVAIGVNERETAFGQSTLFSTLLYLGPDGSVLGRRHRKLMPTYLTFSACS